jgi:hypothetical protein
MAKEIAIDKKVNVFRSDREFLLDIKYGKFEYDELVQKAEELKNGLAELYKQADLPDEPDVNQINMLLISMREKVYSSE